MERVSESDYTNLCVEAIKIENERLNDKDLNFEGPLRWEVAERWRGKFASLWPEGKSPIAKFLDISRVKMDISDDVLISKALIKGKNWSVRNSDLVLETLGVEFYLSGNSLLDPFMKIAFPGQPDLLFKFVSKSGTKPDGALIWIDKPPFKAEHHWVRKINIGARSRVATFILGDNPTQKGGLDRFYISYDKNFTRSGGRATLS